MAAVLAEEAVELALPNLEEDAIAIVTEEVMSFVNWVEQNPQTWSFVAGLLDFAAGVSGSNAAYKDTKFLLDDYDKEVTDTLESGSKRARAEMKAQGINFPQKKVPRLGRKEDVNPTSNPGSESQRNMSSKMDVDGRHGRIGIHDGDTGYVKKHVYQPRIRPKVLALARDQPQVSYPSPWQDFELYGDLRLACSANQSEFNFFPMNTKTQVEDLQSKFRIAIDLADDEKASTASEPFDFSKYDSTVLEIKSWQKLELRNNYNYVVNCSVYHIWCKADNQRGPETMMNDGLHRLQGATTLASAFSSKKHHYVPEDSATFLKHWKISKVERFRLNPGQDTTCFQKQKVLWSNDVLDNTLVASADNLEGLTYGMFVKINGVVGHAGDDAFAVGYAPAYVDIVYSRHYTYRGYGATPFVAIDTLDDSGLLSSNPNIQRSESGPLKATAFNTALV